MRLIAYDSGSGSHDVQIHLCFSAYSGWQVGAALAVDLSAEEGACSGAALEVAVDARGRLCGATMRARSASLHPSSLQVGRVRPVRSGHLRVIRTLPGPCGRL